VDDTSRFGRNKADCLKSLEILTFWEVHLYFVENGLESAQPWFESAFDDRTKADAQFSVSLGHKIRRGRRGRFLAGYNPGGTCYGYMNVPDEDPTRKGEYPKMRDEDKAKEKYKRTDGDYALSWIRREGKGRVFVEVLGHSEHIYANTPMMEHVLAGIQYALGDLKADDSPSVK
jgi:hypothetical protein